MFILLRVLHIVVGAFWVGTVVFVATFLMPTLRAVGPTGGQVMGHLAQVRRLPLVLLTSAWVTLLSGAGLASHDAGTLGFHWFTAGPGRTFGLGASLAVLATLIGMTVNTPTAKRLGVLVGRLQGSGQLPSAEDQAELRGLQARLAQATTAVAVLVVLALGAMAVARYVG
jgi:hypothetical protein